MIRTALFMAVAICAPAFAQKLDLDLTDIAAKAKEKVEVSLDGAMLKSIQSGGLKDAAKLPPEIAKLFSNIESVAVRNYQFEKAGDYSDRDLDRVRRQVSGGAGWSRIINVKEKNENTEIYVFSTSAQPTGFLIIAAEAKELTIVNIAGTVQIAQLKEIVDSTIRFDMASLNGDAKK